MAFFFEVLIGGLLAGVMYSLVALGFVLIYKASGVFNFAQGAMVFFAALTFVGLQQDFGIPFWLAFVLALGVMVAARPRDRAVRAAAARQPAADHAVHGDDRPHLLHRGAGAAAVGRQRPRARHRHPGRADRGDPRCDGHERLAASTSSPPASRRCSWCRWRCSSAAPASGGRSARWPTTTRPRSPSASRCTRSGSSSGRSPGSWRWSPACSGARATACSSRSRSSR